MPRGNRDLARIKQLLAGGAQTLMVPTVESTADAEALVRATLRHTLDALVPVLAYEITQQLR